MISLIIFDKFVKIVAKNVPQGKNVSWVFIATKKNNRSHPKGKIVIRSLTEGRPKAGKHY